MISSREIILLDERDRADYEDFLEKSDFKDILQSWEWGEIKSGFGWKPQRLAMVNGLKKEGIVQVLEKRFFSGLSILYIPRGPVIDWIDPEAVSDFLRLINGFVRKQRGTRPIFLRIESPAGAGEGLKRIFENSGFREYFKTVQPPTTLLIDLDRPQSELFKKLRRTARNLINRSEREGLVVESKSGKDVTQTDLKAFYNLYKITGRRFSFPLRTFSQFELIIEKMGRSGKIRFYTARIKGLVLAHGIVAVLGDRAFYIWGGTGRNKEYSKFFNYGYIWGMLKDLQASRIKTFDFWGLGPTDDKNHPWYGFSLFKTAFDGQRFEYVPAFDLPLSGLYPIFKTLDWIMTPKYRATSS